MFLFNSINNFLLSGYFAVPRTKLKCWVFVQKQQESALRVFVLFSH